MAVRLSHTEAINQRIPPEDLPLYSRADLPVENCVGDNAVEIVGCDAGEIVAGGLE